MNSILFVATSKKWKEKKISGDNELETIEFFTRLKKTKELFIFSVLNVAQPKLTKNDKKIAFLGKHCILKENIFSPFENGGKNE